MSTQGNKLKAIADAIREKEGSSSPIPANDFPARIAAIETGTDTSDATAIAGDILTGKTAYGSSGKFIGTMPDNGAVNQSLNAGASYTIPVGYHNGSGKVTGNSLSSQTQGTATASDIASGKTAWVNGTKINGIGQMKGQMTDFGFLVGNPLEDDVYIFTDYSAQFNSGTMDDGEEILDNGGYYISAGDSSSHTFKCSVGSLITVMCWNRSDTIRQPALVGFRFLDTIQGDVRAYSLLCTDPNGIIQMNQ